MNDSTSGRPTPRVLVVDDNAANLRLCRMALEAAGHVVVAVGDAELALAAARASPPDLVLMDIQLPGMSGLEAMAFFRADPTLAAIPIVALTAHALEADRTAALAAGCIAYITKPIDVVALPGEIEGLIIRAREGRTGQVATNAGRVLIVDDEPANVRLMKMKLHGEPYEVFVAQNGQDALEKAELERPDIILLDVMMPGMDGFEVTRRLKARPETRGIPIILVTALDGPDHKARGFQAGADEFLNKPINTHELITRMNSMVQLKRYRDQLVLRAEPRGAPTEFQTDPEIKNARGRVLVVEDSVRDARLTQGILELEGYDVSIATSAAAARGELASQKDGAIDLVVLDVRLPDADGRDLLTEIKTSRAASPPQVLVATALADVETRLASLELGVDDYLVKPIHAKELELRVQSLVRKKRHMDQLVARADDAVQASLRDGLTGLYTRAYLVEFLTAELARARSQRYPLTVLLLDVDDFKRHNDERGHPGGDEVLRHVARALRTSLRCTDVIARYGGDEFAAVLTYAGTREASLLLERVCAEVGQNTLGEPALAVSIGAVSVAPGIWEPEHLVARADRELYAAKSRGKGRVSLSSLSTMARG